MDEAIEKFKIKATTETKRDEERQFDVPSLTICAEPGFKPSISKKHNLSIPTRYLFYFKHYQFVRNIIFSLIDVCNLILKKNVPTKQASRQEGQKNTYIRM